MNFITDAHLEAIVGDLLEKASSATDKTEANFHRNVIDPFAAIFEMACFQLNSKQWRMSEKRRQAQKTLTNEIGLLHQKLLGAVNGWENLGAGGEVDLVCHKQKIIAEVKNKYNTIKGSNQIDLFRQLENLVMRKSSRYKGYTAYYVEVIPKNPSRYDVAFTPADKEKGKGGKTAENNLIRRIDGASFYALATGNENALEKLFNVLPAVIRKCNASLATPEKSFAEGLFRSAFEPPPKTARRTPRATSK